MRNINSHTRTFKKQLSKCKGTFYAYNDIQFAYGDILEKREDIVFFQANVKLIGCELGDNYSTDFYALKTTGTYFVRECVDKSKLFFPKTLKMLEASRNFWLTKKGVSDWGIVLNEN